MATATAKERVVEKTIVLTLSEDEAQTLAAIFGKIGGGIDGYRGCCDQIGFALAECGYDYGTSNAYYHLSGHMNFDADRTVISSVQRRERYPYYPNA